MTAAHIDGWTGTGLGVSIVRETVEGMGGRAWAEFDGERGSRFLISLPYRRTEDRAAGGSAGDRAS